MRLLLCFLFLLLFLVFIRIPSLQAQQAPPIRYTLSGIVLDGDFNTPIGGAFVAVVGKRNTALTNENGAFELKLEKGTYTIRITSVGMDTYEEKINLTSNKKITARMAGSVTLDEVEFTAEAEDENVTRVEMGLEKMKQEEIKKIPALMGEVDVIKAIQLLPGVQSTSEGSSGFSVRGGSPDQNLILLDNTTVYNASHLMGFFSVFNNDVLSGIELYKGDMPLEHGGRLSSLLDVSTINTMPMRFRGTGGIGVISSRLMLEGPLGDKTFWMLGGRRSYADLFLKLSSDKDLRETSIYFYDMNAKITHNFSDKDKIELNGYYGKDNFGAEMGNFNYGNGTGSLAWSHVFSDKISSRFGLHYTNYEYKITSDIDDESMYWRSSINDIMFRADFDYFLNEKWVLDYGASSIHHRFNPGIVAISGMSDYKVQSVSSLEHGIYLSSRQEINKRLSIKYGVRFSIFQNLGNGYTFNYDDNYEVLDSTWRNKGKVYHTYTAFEPRAGVVYRLSETTSLKANYAHNVQYLQLANNSASGSPMDMWFSASPNVKPQEVDMFSVGYFQNFNNNMYEASVELYYKDQKNVIDFAEHADLMLNSKLEKEIRTGKGKAYGAEFMIRKNKGRFNGFMNYTLARAERTIPEINDGKTYLSPYDKTHTFNIVGNYQLTEKWNISASWVYATGTPTTYPTGRFEIDGKYYPIYSGRNEYRKPDYHRLDISATYVPKPKSTKKWQGEWNFSLYNAYGQKNSWMIQFDQDDSGMPYAESTYLFGIIPSVTYNFKF